jgi:hypothetical protein
MIENHRSELIWKTMKKNPYIIAGLKKAGFTGGWLNTVSGSVSTRQLTMKPAQKPVKSGSSRRHSQFAAR